MVHDPTVLPPDLPRPVDDGEAVHLLGAIVPPLPLRATDGSQVRLDERGGPPILLFAYPRTGRPGEEPPGGLAAWDAIPGARGCTPQACAYRDLHRELSALGARVFGLSTQPTEYQREAVERLELPYPLLSDEKLAFADAMRLPRFEHAGGTFLKRLAMAIVDGRVAHVVYPVFPPGSDTALLADWLRPGRSAAR